MFLGLRYDHTVCSDGFQSCSALARLGNVILGQAHWVLELKKVTLHHSSVMARIRPHINRGCFLIIFPLKSTIFQHQPEIQVTSFFPTFNCPGQVRMKIIHMISSQYQYKRLFECSHQPLAIN